MAVSHADIVYGYVGRLLVRKKRIMSETYARGLVLQL